MTAGRIAVIDPVKPADLGRGHVRGGSYRRDLLLPANPPRLHVRGASPIPITRDLSPHEPGRGLTLRASRNQ
jgi:hypothetical protein